MTNKTKLITGVAIVLIISGLALGYVIAATNSVETDSTQQQQMSGRELNNESQMSESSAESQQAENPVPQESVTLDTAAMTDGQRELMDRLGIDMESITYTPAMFACAEASFGSERVTEIFQGGATPTFIEGSKLMLCYNRG